VKIATATEKTMNVVLERKRKRIGKPVAMMQRAKGTFSRKK